MAPCRLCCLYDIFMGGVRAAEFDIVLNRVREQIHILEYHADIFHQAVQLIIFDINAADTDAAAVNVPKACD